MITARPSDVQLVSEGHLGGALYWRVVLEGHLGVCTESALYWWWLFEKIAFILVLLVFSYDTDQNSAVLELYLAYIIIVCLQSLTVYPANLIAIVLKDQQ